MISDDIRRVTPPPGYQSLCPLDREKHQGYGLSESAHKTFCASLSSIYLHTCEFVSACRAYPIVFTKVGSMFLPVAVTGINQGKNLFFSLEDGWLRDCYVPSYVRRFPFFVVRVADGKQGASRRALVCVDENGLLPESDPSRRFFLRHGEPSALWATREKLIEEMEVESARTAEFTRALASHELYEPVEAHVFPEQGAPLMLKGLYLVSESRLKQLPAKAAKRLLACGYLGSIYSHLISLNNFDGLIRLNGKSKP